MNIDFELYKVFYYVGKHFSFSEAASRLHISQSAVSQAIRQLEEKLGCRLFHRSTKQVHFTHEGELLFHHIEQAFHYIKAGERGIAEIHSLDRGEVRLGASDTICRYYLLPYLKQFVRQYPQIKLAITNRPSSVCLEMTGKGMLDIAVVNLPPGKLPASITAAPLSALHDIFIAGPAYRQLCDKNISFAELRNYPLLLLEKQTITREFFDRLAASHQLTLLPEIEVNSIDLLVDLAKIGLGIAFTAREYVASDLAAGELYALNVSEPIPARYIGVIFNNSLPLTVAAKRFMDMLCGEPPVNPSY